MYNNLPIRFVCSVGMLFFLVLLATAEANGEKTYMEYPEWNLLPKGIDFDDEDDIAAIRQLVDEGPAANEAMLAVVRECDDSMIASRARYLGRRGGQRALEALEQVQGRDANKRVNEEIGKAIASIESRLAVQNADESSPLPMTGP